MSNQPRNHVSVIWNLGRPTKKLDPFDKNYYASPSILNFSLVKLTKVCKCLPHCVNGGVYLLRVIADITDRAYKMIKKNRARQEITCFMLWK